MIRLLLAGLCLFFIAPAYADDQPPEAAPASEEPAHPPQVTEEQPEGAVKITPLSEDEIFQVEAKGLYKTAAEGGFGRNMWEGSTRADITALLKNMPSSAKEPLINKMILGLLLTEADTGKLAHDGPIEIDLLTIRLEKLIEAGAYAQAYELYTSTGREPYSERTAKAAILAMLFSGEKSNACLETNIYSQAFVDDPFWETLDKYCTASLSETADTNLFKGQENSVAAKIVLKEDFIFPYDSQAFAKLSVLDRALIAAENKFDLSNLEAETAAITDLQILLRHESLSPALKIKLTAKAIAYGLVPSETLGKLFATHKKSEKINTEAAPPKEPWKHLLFAYAKIKETGITEHWPLIKNTLTHVEALGPDIYQPFVATLLNINPEGATLDELLKLHKIMLVAGADIPKNLSYTDNFEKKSEKNAFIHFLLRISALISAGNPIEPALYNEIHSAENLHKKDILLHFLNIFMKKLDKGNDYGKHKLAYEKDFFLTYESSYVMPSVFVWDRLENTKQNKTVGETILLSTYLMHDQELHRAYPGLLRDTVLSIRHFNLTKLSNDLLLGALLDK